MIYFVLVDRFANGDPSNDAVIDLADPAAFHGGDLQGVIDHLDHIQSLGADTVWLSPVFAMRTEPFFGHGAFHGYWVEDLDRVEPRFGDEATLRALSDALRARGMKLLLDMVYNHVAPDGELTRTHPEWFHDTPSIQRWEDPVERVTGKVHGLPDLAQEREPVYQHLLAASLRWRELADGFRIDAVRHMPAEFLARLAADVRPDREFMLLGELFDGSPEAVSATARDAGLDAMFDFPLHFAMVDVFCRDASPGALAAVLAQDDAYPHPERLVTFLDNHDLPRILSACGGDRDRVARALAFQLATRGIPSLGYGLEAELEGAKEPENRGDMRFGETATAAFIRDRMELRRRHPALTSGTTRTIALDEEFVAFARESGAEEMIVAVNNGDEPRAVAGHVIPPRSVEVFPATPPPARPPVRVRLRAQAPLAPGDTLLLVGPAQGWDPARGVPLPATLVMDREVHAFKLVIRHADGSVRWEDGPNRYLLPEGGTVRMAWR